MEHNLQTDRLTDGYDHFTERIDTVIDKYRGKRAFTFIRNDKTKNYVTFSDVGEFLKSSKEIFKYIGLKQGDRVALICPHSPYVAFTGIALAYSGITIVLIDASLPAEEIEKLLVFSDVRAVFTVQKIYDRFNRKVIADIPCFEISDELAIIPFDENKKFCMGSTATKDPEPDVIAILFSSGTTGQMKGI